ncbi:MAG: leucine-rich repeat protein [Bacilli bacterium]|nr:leucine-rich repeat protein [Bacilli bacterium]
MKKGFFRSKPWLLLVLSAMALSSCGGGGSGGEPASEPSSSESDPSSSSSLSTSSKPEADPTLTFVTQGGTPIATVTGVKGETIDYSQYVTTKEGAEFIGWYGSADGGMLAPTVFDGAQTVYAYWSGMPGARGFYYGHYPQSKVTDRTLKQAIHDHGTSTGSLGSNDYLYEGVKYHLVETSRTSYDYYQYELINWDWRESADNVYLLTADSVLAYAQMGCDFPYTLTTYEQKANYLSDFSHTELYEWLNGSFLTSAFTADERKDIDGDIRLPSYGGTYKISEVRDWMYNASDYAFSFGDRGHGLVGQEQPNGTKTVYDYWYSSHRARSSLETTMGDEPLEYYYRATLRDGLDSDYLPFADDIDEWHGVVPQFTLDLNEAAERVLHFDTGEGSPIADITVTAKLGKSPSVDLPLEEPTRDDYLFVGWFREPTYATPVEDRYTFGPQEREATLYAMWQYDTTVYESAVTYHLNGGTLQWGTPETVFSDAPVLTQIQNYEPYYDNYHEFVGWFLDEELQQPLSATYKTKKPIDLYAKWAELDPVDIDFAYNELEDGTLEVSGLYEFDYGGVLTIPAAKSDGTVVSRVAANAFANSAGITKVVFPASIKSIGDSAFAGLAITEVEFNSGLERIERRAFFNCSLVEVEWPSSLLYIGDEAFRHNQLTSLRVPDVEYGSYAFCANYALVNVTFDEGMTAIPTGLLNGCSPVGTIVLPESVTRIESFAFGGGDYGEIHLRAGMSLDDEAFRWGFFDKFYIEGNLAENVTSAIFEGVVISELHIGAEVTALPANLTAPARTKVYIDSGFIQWFGLANNDKLLTNATEIYYSGAKLSGEITIPEGQTSIPLNTFVGSEITKITIPDSLTSLPSGAFSGVTTLKEADIPVASMVAALPSSVEKLTIRNYNSIGNFNALKNLKELYILGSTGKYSLNLRNSNNTGKLEKVEIALCQIALSQNGFAGHPNLAEVTLPYFGDSGYPNGAVYHFGTNNLGCVRKLTILGGQLYDNYSYSNALTNVSEIVIGSQVTDIGANAFRNYTSLTNLVFDDPHVRRIGEYAFANTKLTSFVLPATVFNCGQNLFADTPTMTSLSVAPGNATYDSRDNCNCIINTERNVVVVTIPTSVIPESITIATSGFYSNVNQDTFVVPARMTAINEGSFRGAQIRRLDLSANPDIRLNKGGLAGIQGLEELVLGSMPYSLKDLFTTIPDSLTTVDLSAMSSGDLPNNAFATASSLTSVTLPDYLQALPTKCFQGCTGLSGALSFPNVQYVEDYAFAGCRGITSIDLPEALSLENYCFDSCLALQTVNFPKATSMGFGIFENDMNLDVLVIPATLKARSNIYPRPFTDSSLKPKAAAHGIILEEGTTQIIQTFFQNLTADYIVLPSTLQNENLMESCVNDNTQIGKIYWGGTSVSSFTTILNGSDKLGNPNFFDKTKAYFRSRTIVCYSSSSRSGYWHYVDGLPVEW